MTPAAALAFVRRHGIVLASGRGRVPNLATEIAGEPIRGSWWGHPRGQEIFRTLERLGASPEILVCRFIDGKITLVHRRLWPALARVAGRFAADRVSEVRQRHSAAGHHVSHDRPFPDWVPAMVLAESRSLSEADALAALGAAPAQPNLPKARTARRPSGR